MFKKIFCLFIMLTPLVLADNQKEARTQAEALLALLDQGAYNQAYAAGSKLLRDKVTAEQFAAGIQSAGRTVGKRKSRKFVKASHHQQLQGQAGDFYVFRYSSGFANLPEAAELLTVAKENGEWKLAGYQVVKPEFVPPGM